MCGWIWKAVLTLCNHWPICYLHKWPVDIRKANTQMFFDACYLNLDDVFNFSVNVRRAWQWVGRKAVRGRRGCGEAVTRNKTVFSSAIFCAKKEGGHRTPIVLVFDGGRAKEHLQRSSFLIFSSLSPCNSSSILPRQCLLSNWYDRMAPGPSGVKWYKVIGRSSLLTGWPLKALLKGANQILPLPPLKRIPPHLPSHLPSSSAASVTWPGRGIRERMINDAFSTCLEWSCPRRTVITHSQAAAAQHNCFLFVDLVYWGERWLWLGEKVLCRVYRGEGVCVSKIVLSLCSWDPCKLQTCGWKDVYFRIMYRYKNIRHATNIKVELQTLLKHLLSTYKITLICTKICLDLLCSRLVTTLPLLCICSFCSQFVFYYTNTIWTLYQGLKKCDQSFYTVCSCKLSFRKHWNMHPTHLRSKTATKTFCKVTVLEDTRSIPHIVFMFSHVNFMSTS